jgi:hypothetical protein
MSNIGSDEPKISLVAHLPLQQTSHFVENLWEANSETGPL